MPAILLTELGAKVVITDRNPQCLQETQQQIQAQGGQTFCETVDVPIGLGGYASLCDRVHQQYGV